MLDFYLFWVNKGEVTGGLANITGTSESLLPKYTSGWTVI